MAINNQSPKQDLPDGWYRVKLKDVADVYSGATPKTSEPSYWNGDIDWVTPKDLSLLKERSIVRSERRITQKGLESCSATLVAPNSIIMSSRAPIGYLAINKVPVATNQGCKNITPKSNLDVDYLFYYLTQNIDSVKRLGAGSTFAEVGKSAVESVEILIPPVTEQKKIAQILSTVDYELQKTDEVIIATKKIRRGLMQKLFSRGIGHVTFKKTEAGNIPESWEVSRLGDLVDIRSGDTPSGFKFENNGTHPFYKVEDMNQSSKYLVPTRYRFNNYNKPLMPRGMIVFPKRGAAIYTNKVRLLTTDSYFDTNVMGLLAKEGLFSEYLYYLLTHIGLAQFADSTSIAQINNKHIEPLLIPLPKEEEQKKIASILSSVDEKISIHQKLKEGLTILKKGLMQDLLTGKKRTI